MPHSSHQREQSSSNKSTASEPDPTAASQRRTDPDHNPGQETGDQHVIHDMTIDGEHICTGLVTEDGSDVMKMVDDLEDMISSTPETRMSEACVNRASSGSNLKIASPNNLGNALPNKAYNCKIQDRSWAMRRWNSEPVGTHAWHYARLVNGHRRDGSHNTNSAGGDEPDHEMANGLQGVIDVAEDVWSNKASAGAGDEDAEEISSRATAN